MEQRECSNHLNLNKHRLIKLFLCCENSMWGVGKNVVFCGGYKGSIHRFWEGEDDIM